MRLGKKRRKERLRQTGIIDPAQKELENMLHTDTRDTSMTLMIPQSYKISHLYTGSVTKIFLAEDRSHPDGYEPAPDKVIKFPRLEALSEGIKSIETDNKAVGGLRRDNLTEIQFKQLIIPRADRPVPIEIIEYMDAGTLLDLIYIHETIGRHIPWQIGAFIMSRMARGINQLYVSKNPEGEPRRIVHRDISPENTGLSFSGRVKIMDFGSALAEGEEQSKTPEIGKIEYISPDQVMYALVAESTMNRASGSGSFAALDRRLLNAALQVNTKKMQANHKDDIYALGITAYYLMTGINPNNPGETENLYDALDKVSRIHAARERRPLKEIAEYRNCDRNLSLIIKQCCDPDPKNRPKASELVRLLERQCLYKAGFGPTTESLSAYVEAIHGIFYDADEETDGLRGSSASEEEIEDFRRQSAQEKYREKERWKYVKKDCPFLYPH